MCQYKEYPLAESPVSANTKHFAPWQWLQSAAVSDRVLSPIASQVTDLFDDFRAPLLRYLVSLGLPIPDAEDIVQEVFLALFHHLQNQKPTDNLRGWIFRVGHNQALKRRERITRAENSADRNWQLTDPNLNPEEQTASNLLQSRLVNIVNALSERDRCCLNLRAEGLRYREIAEALNISLGAVAASLSRSLAKLGTASQGALR